MSNYKKKMLVVRFVFFPSSILKIAEKSFKLLFLLDIYSTETGTDF